MAKSINILVPFHLEEENLNRIRVVNPSVINVKDVSDLSRAEHQGDQSAKRKYDALLAEAEVIYGNYWPENLLSRAPHLKWVQLYSAGVEHFINPEIISSPIIITNASGIHDVPISEFVLGLMLMFVKQSPLFIHFKEEKRWDKSIILEGLRGKTVGVVGLGSIGKEVARLSKAFGMRVIATRRSVKKAGRSRYVDVLLPAKQLPRLLSESDFVVLTLPLTPETNKIIAEKELRAMKSSAYLINVARGGVIDEDVLIRALREGWIKGAGLDVFTREPLPASSSLWNLPNVILTPHMSGNMADRDLQALGIFTENLKRYLGGKKLMNLVNKERGY